MMFQIVYILKNIYQIKEFLKDYLNVNYYDINLTIFRKNRIFKNSNDDFIYFNIDDRNYTIDINVYKNIFMQNRYSSHIYYKLL